MKYAKTLCVGYADAMWKLEHTVRGAARGWELTVNFDGNEIVCDGTKLDALVLAYETTIHKARDQITQL